LEKLVVDPILDRWKKTNLAVELSSAIELCLLGSLQYLGRGWTFDGLEEATSINEETHRKFFHCFIYWGSTVLYDDFIKYTTMVNQCEKYMSDMNAAGFHGCVCF
jgi:hypothetical protein